MTDSKTFEVIIVGGSYSGLAAGMALGRAMRNVLIMDSGKPCNRQTPHSHNFITHDGTPPAEIAKLAKQQVEKYPTINFFNGLATNATKSQGKFIVQAASGETFNANKLIFSTGINDIMPSLDGYAECWGISVLHCPYCHGYEVRKEKTGILANGENAFEFSKLISHWTDDLTLFTNGPSTLTAEQTAKVKSHRIKIVEKELEKLQHMDGLLEKIIFKDGTTTSLNVLYGRNPFVQHCTIPEKLGCELTEEGYIKVDPMQRTTVPGIYACGDNATRMRTVANAVGMGTAAGAMINNEIIFENF